MHPSSGKDEPNTGGPDTTATRSPRYQTSARLQEMVRNYLSQPGFDSGLPNVSSDSQNGPQIPEQMINTATRLQQVPHDYSGVERENPSLPALLQATQNFHEQQADRESEVPMPALSPGPPNGNANSILTAAAPENQGGQTDRRLQPPTAATEIQNILNTTPAPENNAAGTAFGLEAPDTDGHIAAAHPSEQIDGAREAADMPGTAKLQLEEVAKIEQNGGEQSALVNVVANETYGPTIKATHQEFASEQIQSEPIEKPSEKSAECSPGNERELQLSGRPVRQSAINKPNYSHTHKGITAAATARNTVTPFETEGNENRSEGRDLDDGAGKAHQSGLEERKGNAADSKNRLAGKRSYEEIRGSYENMFAFDWELRDINNLRHPPDREVTPIVVWFYINILYFPYNAQELAKVPFEEFAKPIFERLARVGDLSTGAQPRMLLSGQDQKYSVNKDLPSYLASQSGRSEVLGDEENPEAPPANPGALSQPDALMQAPEDNAGSILGLASGEAGLPELIQKLQIEEHFFEFRDMFRENMQTLMEKIVSEADSDEDLAMRDAIEEEELNRVLPEGKGGRDEALFEMVLSKFEQSLQELHSLNKDQLLLQYSRFTNAYKQADQQANLIIQGQRDIPRHEFPYNPTKLHEYGLDFLSHVDPHFVADIKQNHEWYLQNQNEVLLNVNYPSKQEKEFLRHIEQWQQEKNDLNYKRILQQLAEGADDPNGGPNGLNIQRYNSLSAHKRGLVVQEDAQCAICNNGDYEDEDLIVFCGACNIPVHQRCYGIDEIPDNDWICNNCWAFNMRRGIMVKCILCPKRGGAMKPTSIFRTYEHYMRYHTAAQKKKGLQHSNYFANLAQTRTSTVNSLDDPHKQLQGSEVQQEQSGLVVSGSNGLHQQNLQVTKQASSGRTQRLQFFEREDKNHALSQILSREGNFQEALHLQTKESGDQFPQNNVDLHFLESESIAEIPEDYTFFLQRNEQRLECPETVPTETLYEWVHLSCAMWIPGPSVTPKTPVRMSKIDVKRFDLQCIICGKRNSGACIQCQHSRCMISFHIECARRANYFLEVERVDRERNYRVFCEKHRPLKIVREMEEKDKQTLEEVQKFSKVIDRCQDIYARAEVKQARSKRLQPFSKPPVPEPPSRRELAQAKKEQRENAAKQKRQLKENEMQAKREQQRLKKEQERQEKELQRRLKQEAALADAQKKAQLKAKQELQQKQERQKQQQLQQEQREQQAAKPVAKPEPPAAPLPAKWCNKDTKQLFERIREKFLALFKLRMNVLRVDPMVKIKKQQALQQKKNAKELRKLEKKRKEKMTEKMKKTNVSKVTIQLGPARSGLRSRSGVYQPFGTDGDQDDIGQADMSSSVNQFQRGDSLIQENPELSLANNHQKKSEVSIGAIGENEDAKDETDQEDSRRPKADELLAPEEVDPYYKLANPIFVQDLDWAITFSKYDFPWHEIKFGKFSAKECYRKYTSTVRDVKAFFKNVLGGKDKFRKYILGQWDEPQRVFFGSLPDDCQIQNQEVIPETIDDQDDAGGDSDIECFCKCRGEYNSLTGYFVACESENDCINGGWLHPECTRDLIKMTQDEIMKLDKWYCEDCVDRRLNEGNKEGTDKNKGAKQSQNSQVAETKVMMQQPKLPRSSHPPIIEINIKNQEQDNIEDQQLASDKQQIFDSKLNDLVAQLVEKRPPVTHDQPVIKAATSIHATPAPAPPTSTVIVPSRSAFTQPNLTQATLPTSTIQQHLKSALFTSQQNLTAQTSTPFILQGSSGPGASSSLAATLTNELSKNNSTNNLNMNPSNTPSLQQQFSSSLFSGNDSAQQIRPVPLPGTTASSTQHPFQSLTYHLSQIQQQNAFKKLRQTTQNTLPSLPRGPSQAQDMRALIDQISSTLPNPSPTTQFLSQVHQQQQQQQSLTTPQQTVPPLLATANDRSSTAKVDPAHQTQPQQLSASSFNQLQTPTITPTGQQPSQLQIQQQHSQQAAQSSSSSKVTLNFGGKISALLSNQAAAVVTAPPGQQNTSDHLNNGNSAD